MNKLKIRLTLLAAMLAYTAASHAAINIQTSYVGDAGNTADSTGYGAVSYGYHVGTYEVTNSQYVSFLNAKGATNAHGLYNPNMDTWSSGGILQDGASGSFTYRVKSGMGDRPVNFVGFWDAARFSNWLTNGQGNGSTETGVYTLGDVTNPLNDTVTRNAEAWNAGGVAVASEDEWYKAAYFSLWVLEEIRTAIGFIQRQATASRPQMRITIPPLISQMWALTATIRVTMAPTIKAETRGSGMNRSLIFIVACEAGRSMSTKAICSPLLG